MFAQCTALTEITIPDSVTKICHGAFANDGALEKADIPAGVTEIGESAFSGCKLPKVVVPDGVKTIPYDAFGSNRYSLTEVVLPEGLERIESGAFGGCYLIPDISIPASVTYVSPTAFETLENGVSVHEDNTVYSAREKMLYSKDGTELVYCPFGANNIITVPEGTKKIGGLCFCR